MQKRYFKKILKSTITQKTTLTKKSTCTQKNTFTQKSTFQHKKFKQIPVFLSSRRHKCITIMSALWWSCIQEGLLWFFDILDSTQRDIIHSDIRSLQHIAITTYCHHNLLQSQYNAITTYCHHNLRPLQHFASTTFGHCNILPSQNYPTSGKKDILPSLNSVLPRNFAIKDIVPPDILPYLILCHLDVLQHHCTVE